MWYLKQLLPFKYKTQYIDDDGIHDVSWRMWFGVCFWVQENTW